MPSGTHTPGPRNNPYSGLPPTSRWKNAVSNRVATEIDPTLPGLFEIAADTRIASAGSCFAQRISEELRRLGYRYMLMEPGPAFLSEEACHALGYDIYSARYGNIYTAAQLLQLFRRAFGGFTPTEPLWCSPAGGVVDPFRPGIQPDGFESQEECLWDRDSHLQAVRRLFTELDVFIFTLGLTESWRSTSDGAVFPVAPGSGLGGTFDPAAHEFKNFSVGEITNDLSAFVDGLAVINPAAKIILTVSPVPLIATFEDRHVLQATVYSKSVLRVAAEEMTRKYAQVDYFPSYEIVSHIGDASAYFEADRRTVKPEAVSHVMTSFQRQFVSHDPARVPVVPTKSAPPSRPDQHQPMCDEDAVLAALAREAAPSPIT